MTKRTSRKRRKPRPASAATPAATLPPEATSALERGYSRSRQRDDEARAALEPLAPGERPRAVTVGAIVAAVAASANVIALIASNDHEAAKTANTILGTVIVAVVVVGMWRARYWGVLGMQALLAITIILSALALLTAVNARAVVLALALLAASGTLFWFLVKAMARIQMPARPGAEPRD